MLIKCPECKRDVSDRASVCPVCGCPISENGETQTIEQTGKEYKMAMLVSAAVFFLFILLALSTGELGFVLFALISLIVHIFARVGAWWNHG